MPLKQFGSKKKIGKTIAIGAGKGGVGKSTVTANLARALSQKGRKVGILDADLYGPSMRILFSEERRPVQKEGKIIPAISEGIQYLSLAFFRPEEKGELIRAPIANRLISEILKDTDFGELDYLLIDLPPGTGDIHLTLAQLAKIDFALIVTTPQKIAVADVRKCISMFQTVNIPVLGVVENMSYFLNPANGERLPLFGAGGGRWLADEYKIPFLQDIPLHQSLSELSDEGRSIFQGNDSLLRSIQQSFLSLASSVESEIENALKKQHEEPGGLKILSLTQKDPRTFTILWSDHQRADYTLQELQSKCPCAACATSGEALKKDLGEGLSAHSIQNVGRYAIRINFTKGCSNGIFDFELLRKMKGL